MKVLAVYNLKGGVGKTSTAVHLAHVAAANGARTLIWDLDPQGAASFCFRVKAAVKGGSERLVEAKKGIDPLIRATDYEGLDILPADFSYRHFDVMLSETKKPLARFGKVLKPLRHEYDYVILDCPPGLTLSSEAVFAVSDALVIPTIPTTLSLRTLEQLIRFKKKHKLDHLRLLAFFSMVDKRKKLHNQILAAQPKMRPWVMEAHIPYASAIEQISSQRRPLTATHPHSPGADHYRALWQELQLELNRELAAANPAT
jgi:cellulose biosynthesis protein BcsQ